VSEAAAVAARAVSADRKISLFGFLFGGCHDATMTEDAALLRRFADEHDHAAFAELVRRHLDAVYSSALRRVSSDTHLAQDVTQQVFVALARRARVAALHPALTAWLFVATRHVAANAVRTERRRKAREQLAATMPDSTPDRAASVDWSRLAPLLDGELDRLPEHDRTALLLRFLDNRRYADIANALSLTEDAARRRVDRALEKLRVSLTRRGLTSTSAALALALTQHAVAAAPPALASTATAAAATTAPAALTLLQLMTATKLSTATLAATALLVVSLGTATYEFSRAHATGAALALARETESALTVRLHALDLQVTAAERDAATLAEKLHASETTSAAGASADSSASRAATSASKPAPRDPAAEGTAFMQRHQAVRQALADWFDARTNYSFSAFYEQAGLTADQIRQFLVLKRQGSFGMGLGPTSEFLQFQLQPSDSWRDTDKNIAALLGPEKYQQYQHYNSSLPVRELTSQLASALAFSPEPLTAAQFDQFTQALVSAGAVELARTGPAYNWTTIAQAGGPALSSEQRNALAALRAQAEFDEAYSRAADALNHPSP
jgi:RNA polymerase sigma factor (sigma-70 family)